MAEAAGEVQTDTAASSSARRRSRYLIAVGLVIMLAGALFGYDQGVISGALTGIQKQFHVGTLLLEVITSWVTLGAMAGALVAGWMADRLGRRLTIIAAAILFVIGALGEALAPGTPVLVIGRLVVGFGVGVASVAAPLYASELAPARIRGRMISLYQLAITMGIFVAYFADYLLTQGDRWRLMLGISAVPAALLFLAILPLPDSPRWFVKMGRHDEARAALDKVEQGRDIDAELAEMEELNRHEATGGWKAVFAPTWRKPLMIGVDPRRPAAVHRDQRHHLLRRQDLRRRRLCVTCQPEPRHPVGHRRRQCHLHVRRRCLGRSLRAKAPPHRRIDGHVRQPGGGRSHVREARFRLARRRGRVPTGIVTLVGLVVFIASFAFSLGPVVWTIINEIFPSHIRGKAVAIATGVNWFSAWLVAQFFLSLVSLITEAGTFWLFAAFCLATLVFVHRVVPETKGRTLEELELLWRLPRKRRAATTTPIS